MIVSRGFQTVIVGLKCEKLKGEDDSLSAIVWIVQPQTMYQAMQFLKADIKQGLLVLLVYITISKTNRQLRSFARFGLTKLRNSIPAEIRQYPKMP